MTVDYAAADLDIPLAEGNEPALFKWLLASFLMGKPIRRSVAARAYRLLVDTQGYDTPAKLAAASRGRLVSVLGEAGYTRYDHSTAERLQRLALRLQQEYAGRVATIREVSASRAECEGRLLQFDGIGPVTLAIFMAEVAPLWY
ncbi:MAG: DNA methylase [Pseudomonas sp.]|uniref:DNA methylase n=1 Tax=Pseudomonas sp. TaxID=306 RepID=UPI00339A1429